MILDSIGVLCRDVQGINSIWESIPRGKKTKITRFLNEIFEKNELDLDRFKKISDELCDKNEKELFNLMVFMGLKVVILM